MFLAGEIVLKIFPCLTTNEELMLEKFLRMVRVSGEMFIIIVGRFRVQKFCRRSVEGEDRSVRS
jgi:hypothetical protein